MTRKHLKIVLAALTAGLICGLVIPRISQRTATNVPASEAMPLQLEEVIELPVLNDIQSTTDDSIQLVSHDEPIPVVVFGDDYERRNSIRKVGVFAGELKPHVVAAITNVQSGEPTLADTAIRSVQELRQVATEVIEKVDETIDVADETIDVADDMVIVEPEAAETVVERTATAIRNYAGVKIPAGPLKPGVAVYDDEYEDVVGMDILPLPTNDPEELAIEETPVAVPSPVPPVSKADPTVAAKVAKALDPAMLTETQPVEADAAATAPANEVTGESSPTDAESAVDDAVENMIINEPSSDEPATDVSAAEQTPTEADVPVADQEATSQEPVEALEPTEPTKATVSAPVDPERQRAVYQGDRWFVPPSEMTAEMEARRERINQVMEFYYNRHLNTRDDSPWSMMHHMIAWGSDALIWVGSPGNRRVSCIGWLCANGECEGARMMELKNGRVVAKTGPGLQGHDCQFLAMLAQSRIRSDQPMRVSSKTFNVAELVGEEMRTCRNGIELTFKLIGLSHYLHTDENWTTYWGEEWNVPRLIREELNQPINGTTCGGTHRLMGLAYAVRRREQDQLPVTGAWKQAKDYVKGYQNLAYRMQNRDGSFSTDFFRSQGDWGGNDRKLKTSGHILELLVFSHSHDELNNPRLNAAVDLLCTMLINNRYYDWEKGPLGHAIRALTLYHERVYGVAPGNRNLELADRPIHIKPRPDKAKKQAAKRQPQQARRPQLPSPIKRWSRSRRYSR